MHGAAAPVTLPVSTVASKQLPDVTVVRVHNVPGGINVHGLMDCLLKHFHFGLSTLWYQSMGAMPQVTLLLPFQPVAAQTCA